MIAPLLTLTIQIEADIVNARQRARHIAALAGFEAQDQSRIATAVSEIARNAFAYGRGGKASFSIEGEIAPQELSIVIFDQGPGIPNLNEILNGHYRSKTGMGMGLLGTRKLMDDFEIETEPGRGTRVSFKKTLPARAPVIDSTALARISVELARTRPDSPLQEVQQQNREMLRVLGELRTRQEALTLLNQELVDTNRGMVALYAELDEKADHLRRADELKSRFLSNMSHEFRTPLNSMLALTRMLLDETDGKVNVEQRKQLGFVLHGAESLLGLVNDLLDLARIEAGKTVVRPEHFSIADLFSALRGMLKPLLVNPDVELIFEPVEMPPIFSDEGKVSQILRNFISNALKFTQRGEIRVSAALDPDGTNAIISVADTGIGIAAEHHAKIFEEYGQVESTIQRRVHGTGLGLPLSLKLAQLLGGGITLKSSPGIGSTFTVQIPIGYTGSPGTAPQFEEIKPDRSARLPVLAVEDDPAMMRVYEEFLRDKRFQLVPARSLNEARNVLKNLKPVAVLLDAWLGKDEGWTLLKELKNAPLTSEIPVLMISVSETHSRGRALGADACAIKPITEAWLVGQLEVLTREKAARTLLIVDDSEAWRYLLKGYLSAFPFEILEANDGLAGCQRAREDLPQAIFLDLCMPEQDGTATLAILKQDPLTRDIPVFIMSSLQMSLAQREALLQQAHAVLSKDASTREDALDQIRQVLTGAGLIGSSADLASVSGQEEFKS